MEARRCVESRFSLDPLQNPNAVITLFGWMLCGAKLTDAATNLATVSNFLVRRLGWPLDDRDLHDIILTDKGETFLANFDPDHYDKEGFMKILCENQEMLEFGLKYSMGNPIAYDMMVHNLDYAKVIINCLSNSATTLKNCQRVVKWHCNV